MHLKYVGNYLTVVRKGKLPHRRVKYVLIPALNHTYSKYSVMRMRARGDSSWAAEVNQWNVNNIHSMWTTDFSILSPNLTALCLKHLFIGRKKYKNPFQSASTISFARTYWSVSWQTNFPELYNWLIQIKTFVYSLVNRILSHNMT